MIEYFLKRKEQIQVVAILTLTILIAGFVAPWWTVGVIGFIYALFFDRHAPFSKTWMVHLEVVIATKLAWFFPILLQDALVGWRTSLRIAGVVGLPAGIFAYALTVWFGCLAGLLGSLAGANLRAALPPHFASSFRRAGRQAD